MAFSSPGVYVSESKLSSSVRSVNLSSSVAAFFGTSERGPVTPTLIQSWTDYIVKFGGISTDHDLGYAVYHYFANGGSSAYVTRVVNPYDDTATTGVYYRANDTGASTPAVLFNVSAINPGTWGNDITVTVSAGIVELVESTTIPTFNLAVSYKGVEVERWTELSPLASSSRFVESVINTGSNYITASMYATITTASASAGFSYLGGIDGASVGGVGGTGGAGDTVEDGLVTYYLADGTSSNVCPWEWVHTSPTNYSVFDLLDLIEGVLIINPVGQSDTDIIAAALAKAVERGNSIVLIDPDTSVTDASGFTSQATAYRSMAGVGYGVLCAPMLTMVDPARSGAYATRRTYPGGAIAGLYARTESERTVGKTPAGYGADIRNALGVDIKFKETEIGTLYDNGVNCLKQLPGAAVVLFGGRTLERLNPDRYVSVRRSLNYLKQALKDATQFAVFEPNDERLWSAVNAACGNVLSRFWSSGGLKGTTQQNSYYVICNSSNNTPSTIDNGEVRVEIGVALQQPAEFIVIQISQWTGGSNAVETL